MAIEKNMSTCPACGDKNKKRHIATKARNEKKIIVNECCNCQHQYIKFNPTVGLLNDKLDESRLKSAGLEIPPLEKDFENGIIQNKEYIRSYFNEKDKKTNILEIGSSWGYFLKLVQNYGCNAYGIEINGTRCKHVNEKLRIPCFQYLERIEELGLKFKKIFLFYVLEYIQDPVDYINRLIKILDKNGEIVIITPNQNDVLKDVYENKSFNSFFYDEYAINYFTKNSLEVMCSRLKKIKFKINNKQGYSVCNHINWEINNKPTTTGMVGGDRFIEQISSNLNINQNKNKLAKVIDKILRDFDKTYRNKIELAGYGNQLILQLKKIK
jgi:2-polyprenyl-3-methyl-5-hydroxy-6-metoxy-1,4-benzoquinol methylase